MLSLIRVFFVVLFCLLGKASAAEQVVIDLTQPDAPARVAATQVQQEKRWGQKVCGSIVCPVALITAVAIPFGFYIHDHLNELQQGQKLASGAVAGLAVCVVATCVFGTIIGPPCAKVLVGFSSYLYKNVACLAPCINGLDNCATATRTCCHGVFQCQRRCRKNHCQGTYCEPHLGTFYDLSPVLVRDIQDHHAGAPKS